MVEKEENGKKTLSMTDKEKEELIKVMRDNTIKKLDEMQKIHKNQMLGMAQEMHIMYESYIKAGFTKKEAMELLKTIVSSCVPGK